MNAYASIVAHPREALQDGLEKVRAGMLGVDGSSQHMQPMTHFPDWEANRIWFLTSKDTDLVRELKSGAPAKFCVTDQEHGFDACIKGHLTEDLDRAKLDEYWSPVAGAWFQGGKDDPKLTMLRFDLVDAALWGSTDSKVKFGFEILKANMDEDKTPDVGAHTILRF
ncbi:pyridoxamine 5'-phosphate oxidase family protein [Pararhodobacter marinus]|uniref:General stress protein n=1 Tax=Pararhodobacter marinus TaxID=2184063 RepID=A0A2U2CCA4_9RHOB|nr:pyridoxamine 5'-phosphate oxidase family protein [Pararhodobacter marinus]PWE29482.1 general stress protein [Pararhodobacter marinus]